MSEKIDKLQLYIAELENRIAYAAEQLHSLANEQIHRRNGAEIDAEDLEEVVDILVGKK